MKLVYTSPNSLMVDHMKLMLDSAGIDCVVERRHLSSLAGLIPSQETWPELWVLDERDEERARLLLHESPNDTSSAQHVCLGCGEALTEPFITCWRCGAESASVHHAAFDSEDEEGELPLPPRPLSLGFIQWIAIIAATAVALTMLAIHTASDF